MLVGARSALSPECQASPAMVSVRLGEPPFPVVSFKKDSLMYAVARCSRLWGRFNALQNRKPAIWRLRTSGWHFQWMPLKVFLSPGCQKLGAYWSPHSSFLLQSASVKCEYLIETIRGNRILCFALNPRPFALSFDFPISPF